MGVKDLIGSFEKGRPPSCDEQQHSSHQTNNHVRSASRRNSTGVASVGGGSTTSTTSRSHHHHQEQSRRTTTAQPAVPAERFVAGRAASGSAAAASAGRSSTNNNNPASPSRRKASTCSSTSCSTGTNSSSNVSAGSTIGGGAGRPQPLGPPPPTSSVAAEAPVRGRSLTSDESSCNDSACGSDSNSSIVPEDLCSIDTGSVVVSTTTGGCKKMNRRRGRSSNDEDDACSSSSTISSFSRAGRASRVIDEPPYHHHDQQRQQQHGSRQQQQQQQQQQCFPTTSATTTTNRQQSPKRSPATGRVTTTLTKNATTTSALPGGGALGCGISGLKKLEQLRKKSPPARTNSNGTSVWGKVIAAGSGDHCRRRNNDVVAAAAAATAGQQVAAGGGIGRENSSVDGDDTIDSGIGLRSCDDGDDGDDQRTRCTSGVFSTVVSTSRFVDADAQRDKTVLSYHMGDGNDDDDSGDNNINQVDKRFKVQGGGNRDAGRMQRERSSLGVFLKNPASTAAEVSNSEGTCQGVNGDAKSSAKKQARGSGFSATRTVVTSAAMSDASPGLSVEIFSKKNATANNDDATTNRTKKQQTGGAEFGESGELSRPETPISDGSSSQIMLPVLATPCTAGKGILGPQRSSRRASSYCSAARGVGLRGGRRNRSASGDQDEGLPHYKKPPNRRRKSFDGAFPLVGSSFGVGVGQSSRRKSFDAAFPLGGSSFGVSWAHSSWTSGLQDFDGFSQQKKLQDDKQSPFEPFKPISQHIHPTQLQNRTVAALEFDPYSDNAHLSSSASLTAEEELGQQHQYNSNKIDGGDGGGDPGNDNDKGKDKNWWEDSDDLATNKESGADPADSAVASGGDVDDRNTPAEGASETALEEVEGAAESGNVVGVDAIDSDTASLGREDADVHEAEERLDGGVAEEQRIGDEDEEEASLTIDDLLLPDESLHSHKEGTTVEPNKNTNKVKAKASESNVVPSTEASKTDASGVASFQLKRRNQHPETFKLPPPCKPDIQKLQVPGTANANPRAAKAADVASSVEADKNVKKRDDNEQENVVAAQEPHHSARVVKKDVTDKPSLRSTDDYILDDGRGGVPKFVDAAAKPLEDLSLLDDGEDQSCLSIPLPRPPPLAGKSTCVSGNGNDASGGTKKKIIKVRTTKPNGESMSPNTFKQTVARMQASGELPADAEIVPTTIRKKKKKVVRKFARGPREGSQRSARSRSIGPPGENSERPSRSRSKAPAGDGRARARSKGPPQKTVGGEGSTRSRGQSMGRKAGAPSPDERNRKMRTSSIGPSGTGGSEREARSTSIGNFGGSMRKARSTSIGYAGDGGERKVRSTSLGPAKHRSRSKSRSRAAAQGEGGIEPDKTTTGRGRWGLPRRAKSEEDEGAEERQRGRGRSVGPKKNKRSSARGSSADRSGEGGPGSPRCKSLGPGTRHTVKGEQQGSAAAHQLESPAVVSDAVVSNKASTRSKSVGRLRSKSAGRRASTGTGSTEPTTPSIQTGNKRMGNFFQTLKNVVKTPRSPVKKRVTAGPAAVVEREPENDKPPGGGILKKKKATQTPRRQKQQQLKHEQSEALVKTRQQLEQVKPSPLSPPSPPYEESVLDHGVPMSIEIVPESTHTRSSTAQHASLEGQAPPSPLTCSSPNHRHRDRPHGTSPKHERRPSDVSGVSDDVMFRTIKEVGVTEDMLEKLFEAGLVITEG